MPKATRACLSNSKIGLADGPARVAVAIAAKFIPHNLKPLAGIILTLMPPTTADLPTMRTLDRPTIPRIKITAVIAVEMVDIVVRIVIAAILLPVNTKGRRSLASFGRRESVPREQTVPFFTIDCAGA